MKYKYGPDRVPAASSEIIVTKIEVSLKDQKIFASGVDSTFIHVKLFDKEGNLVTKVLPHEIYLSSSEDIEAKPFSLKQGIYKAEIKPRQKSADIRLQVYPFTPTSERDPENFSKLRHPRDTRHP